MIRLDLASGQSVAACIAIATELRALADLVEIGAAGPDTTLDIEIESNQVAQYDGSGMRVAALSYREIGRRWKFTGTTITPPAAPDGRPTRERCIQVCRAVMKDDTFQPAEWVIEAIREANK